MGYSALVVKKVREQFENKRQEAANLAARHLDEVYFKCPHIREIDHALSLTGLKVFEAATKDPKNLEQRITEIKKENLELQEVKKATLREAGFPEDYIDIKYSCDKCLDTGYDGLLMCSCMKKALVKEAYNCSGLGSVLGSQTFRNFDLNYYSDESSESKMSDREIMQSILEKAKQYVSDFGKSGRESNLLFVGTTGLGKTHITTAIAKGVIDKGFDVVYDSAQNIIRAFEQQRFDKDEVASFDVNRYFDCDLLIIDDLGTEFRNSFTQSVLYNLLNTRINSGKCMIVSTNIDEFSSFQKYYDDRITSRLLGSFRSLRFVGNDIRIQKVKNSTKK